MLITLELVRDTWRACYPADRLAQLYDRPHTVLDVLTRSDGAWADVPLADRLWTVLRENVIPDRILRLFAADCAEHACLTIGWSDPRSLAAIQAARDFANRLITHDQMACAADAAAYAARAACAARAARAACAADAAACAADAAAYAARAACAACAADVAVRAADAAARTWQVERLANLIRAE